MSLYNIYRAEHQEDEILGDSLISCVSIFHDNLKFEHKNKIRVIS
jgi:hypothetical protein